MHRAGALPAGPLLRPATEVRLKLFAWTRHQLTLDRTTASAAILCATAHAPSVIAPAATPATQPCVAAAARTVPLSFGWQPSPWPRSGASPPREQHVHFVSDRRGVTITSISQRAIYQQSQHATPFAKTWPFIGAQIRLSVLPSPSLSRQTPVQQQRPSRTRAPHLCRQLASSSLQPPSASRRPGSSRAPAYVAALQANGLPGATPLSFSVE